MISRALEQRKLMAVQLSNEMDLYRVATREVVEATLAIVTHDMACNNPECDSRPKLILDKRAALEKLALVCEEMAGTVRDMIAADDKIATGG